MAQLPDGTVTFLFSDVEGSTRLLERDAPAAGAALARHHELFDAAVIHHSGVIFETVGDAVYAAFSRPSDAVAAALDAQRAMAGEEWGAAKRLAVRIALHTGQVERRGDHYFGPVLFRAARLQALGHGGQTLLSGLTAGLADGSLPEKVSLRDLGTHRLKDLTEPEHVFELVHPDLQERFPALRSLDAHPNNLPSQLSSFIGREAEIRQIRLLLDDCRLVTLVGPGGIGKTRLSLQVAADRLHEHADGAFFVDLAVVRDPAMVLRAIAAALHLEERSDQPIGDTLSEHLSTRDVLLILDNLEQLQPAVAPTLADLLRNAPGIRVLATSRTPLGIQGEHRFAVPPMDLGAPDRFDAQPPAAVMLFAERARAAGSELEIDHETGPIIRAICHQLDGLPLAIELATARMRLLGLGQLRDRLAERLPLLTGGAADMPTRHRTLHATIEWSAELLTEEQRHVLSRLGVFAGGFTLEGAQAVAGADVGDMDEALDALVMHSLVRRTPEVVKEPRFSLLETIREYAAERLERSGDAETVRERHAAYLLELVTPAFVLPINADRSELYRRIEVELENIRASMRWLLDSQRAERALELAAMLGQFLVDRGPAAEGREWVAQSLAAAQDADALTRARALRFAWSLHFMSGDVEAADAAIVEAIELFDGIGAERELGQALARQGNAFEVQGHIEEARRVLARAADIARRHGDDVTWRRALVSLAHIFIDEGDVNAGERALTEVYEDALRADDRMSVLIAGSDLSSMRLVMGRAADAIAPARDAVAAARRAGRLDPLPIANLASAQVATGDVAAGRRTLAEAVEMMTASGDQADLAAILAAQGSLEARDGDAAIAAWCLAASEKLSDDLGYKRRDVELAFEQAERDLVRTRLSEEEFTDAWDRGSRATLEEGFAIVTERAAVDRERP